MRYFLTHHGDHYFIITGYETGIIADAVRRGTTPIASVYSISTSYAVKHLYTIALIHFRKSLSETTSILPDTSSILPNS